MWSSRYDPWTMTTEPHDDDEPTEVHRITVPQGAIPPAIAALFGLADNDRADREAESEAERLKVMWLMDSLNGEQLETLDYILLEVGRSSKPRTVAMLFSGMIEREKYIRSNPLTNTSTTPGE